MWSALFLIAVFAPIAAPLSRWNDLDEAFRISDLPYQLSRVDKSENPKCSEDIYLYFQGLQKNEIWANRMFDSVEKSTTGLLYGRQQFIGNFDECLSARAENFTGKYCLMDINIQQPNNSAFRLSYGICIPSSCNGSDIEKAFDFLNLNISVEEEGCWTDDPKELSPGDRVVICFFGFFVFISLSSTVFDLLYNHNYISVSTEQHELYSSFSLHNNMKQLMRISQSAGSISCLHGIRTLTMCWVVLGHEYVMPVFGSTINPIVIIEYLNNKNKILITNALVSVDTFFLLSGLLVVLVFFRDISKKKTYDVPVAMIHRFIRITPAYAIMVLIQSTIVLKFGRGPLWHRQIAPGVKVCQENWWSGLLYIQNFVSPTSTCLGQSWYLSSDMQMFWLSPILLYPLMLWPKFSYLFFILALGLALTTNFVVSYLFELGPHIMRTNSADQFSVDYVQTHMRLAPYIVGMSVGYFICGLKANKIRFSLSKVWIITGWIISAGLCIASMFGIAYFLDNPLESQHPYTLLDSSSYLTFHRLGWSLGIAWVILACVGGYGGIVNTFLSWDGFQVLGKLSYCIFLVHFSVQICKSGMAHVSGHIGDFDIVTSYFSSLFMAALLSIPLYLLFEVPFSNLDRYFLRNVRIFPYPKPRVQEVDSQKVKSVDAEGTSKPEKLI